MANENLGLALLQAAAQINPYSQNRIGNLAGALATGVGAYKQGQAQQAQQQQLAQIGGSGPDRYQALAQYWADKDPAKAKQYLELADSLNPRKPKAFGQSVAINGRLVQLTESGEPIDLGPAPAEAAKAPVTRTIKRGREEVTQEWDGTKFVDVATAPRELGGGPAPAQPNLITTLGPDGKPQYELVAPGTLPRGAPVTGQGAAGIATEDERKAAGWFTAAKDALGTIKALGQEAGTPNAIQAGLAAIPSFGIGQSIASATRGEGKRKYDQAMAVASDAILRAATGAGQNEGEVKRKLDELTPSYLDPKSVKDQKLRSLELYVESLKTRAGRALPQQQSAIPQQSPALLSGGAIKRYNPATGRIE